MCNIQNYIRKTWTLVRRLRLNCDVCPAGEPSGVSVHVSGSDWLLQTAGLRPSESSLCSHHPVWICDGGTHTHTHTHTQVIMNSHMTFTHLPPLLQVNGTEADFAKRALFSRHPEMIDWPSDHNWFFAKFNITQVHTRTPEHQNYRTNTAVLCEHTLTNQTPFISWNV